jgi:hypothetical protein
LNYKVLPKGISAEAATFVKDVIQYHEDRASQDEVVTERQEKWLKNGMIKFSELKKRKGFKCKIPFEELLGGKIYALRYMSRLLDESEGVYTWLNYATFWDNDHFPIPYASINVRDLERTARIVLHYKNYRPLEHHPNMCANTHTKD